MSYLTGRLSSPLVNLHVEQCCEPQPVFCGLRGKPINTHGFSGQSATCCHNHGSLELGLMPLHVFGRGHSSRLNGSEREKQGQLLCNGRLVSACVSPVCSVCATVEACEAPNGDTQAGNSSCTMHCQSKYQSCSSFSA